MDEDRREDRRQDRRPFWDALGRWPLLTVGVLLVGWAVQFLADAGDRSDARALVLGVGAMLMGAGLVLIVLGPRNGGDD
jgi:hypothetical protein